MSVRAKKGLGQHFLKDFSICEKMTREIASVYPSGKLLEVGPGTGALTKFLLACPEFETSVIELDSDSIEYLKVHFPNLTERIHYGDFLRTDLTHLMGTGPFAVVGNFPYYISSQIVFKVLEHRSTVPVMVGMFQMELAKRICSGPGSKVYGIISVLTQAFYDAEYLFTVEESAFVPPPKVKSGVIRLVRNQTERLSCDENDFRTVVRTAFNQRRKTLRNSLKSLLLPEQMKENLFTRRPETLTVNEFVDITRMLLKTGTENTEVQSL